MLYLSFLSLVLILFTGVSFASIAPLPYKSFLCSIIKENPYKDLDKFLKQFTVKEYSKSQLMAVHHEGQYLVLYDGVDQLGIFHKSGKKLFFLLDINHEELFPICCSITNSHVFLFLAGAKGMIVSIGLDNSKKSQQPVYLSIPHPITSGEALEGGKLFFRDIMGTVYCYAVHSEYMREIWRNQSAYSKTICNTKEKILLYEKRLYLSINDGSVLVINQDNGATIGKLDCGSGLYSSIIDIKNSDHYIWVLTTGGLFQFDGESLRMNQELLGINPISEMCIVKNGERNTLYFHDNKFLFIINRDNIREYIKISLQDFSNNLQLGSPIIKDHRILLTNNRGGLIIINSINNKIMKYKNKITRISHMNPVIFNGVIIWHCNLAYKKIFKGLIIKKIKNKKLKN